MGGSGVVLDGFDFDNTPCVDLFERPNIPNYMRSSINIYPSTRFMENVTMVNITGQNENDVLVHMMGLSRLFPYTRIRNVTLNGIRNGKVMLDTICGDIRSQESDIIYSTLSNECIIHSIGSNANVIESLGPRSVVYLDRQIYGISKQCQNKKQISELSVAFIVLSVLIGLVVGIFGEKLIAHVHRVSRA